MDRMTSSAEPREGASRPWRPLGAHPEALAPFLYQNGLGRFCSCKPPAPSASSSSVPSATSRGAGVREQFRPDTCMALEKP